ncbi:hypothetical protein BIY37_12340 [Candidatus Brocadia sapporoensis]|uniref:Diguanylate cyclase n=1 Tax=Candidatus Brocadia sapporoensis TaxID=392547 RepID=A0A1V6LX26_9BACT|nr:diguanylate cyclase [Candidatus Brocadia sapporoensis]MDG6006124.1 diguanylate cyclase [Candidatus Brocadia sp.]OQD44690.1 hypothetical protein BIY37_12340 [Candidatus Brocadia sapporoensis]GJQ23543.1 MAG: hypothetical protein HBSAPP01_13330 [Candidatus Brocadia sapporoensis]
MKKNFTNNMTPTYITALSIIAMLSIASYITLKKRISSQETDAAVINLTSKQRFLLQNIAIYSLCLVNAKDRAETESLRQDLLATMRTIETVHKGLVSGDKSLNLSGKQSPQIRALYFKQPVHLNKKMNQYLAEAKALAHAPPEKLTSQNPHLHNILNEFAADLADSLEIIVNLLQKESERDNKKLHLLETVVLGIVLFALVIIGMFIFRPMVNRIKEEGDKLLKGETRTRLIIDSAVNGIISFTQNGTIKSFNPAAGKMFGYQSPEIIEKHLNTLLTEPYHKKVAGWLQGILQRDTFPGSKLTAFEVEGQRNDNTTFPMELNLSTFYQDDQLFYLMIVRDFTEQKRTKQRTDVQYAVTRVLTNSNNIEETTKELLQTIGQTLNCALGFFWDADKNNHILLRKEIWHTMSALKGTAELPPHQISFASKTEIPGIAYSLGKPVWIPDVLSDPRFSSSPLVLRYQLPGALAFPVTSDKEILGVFEFLMREKHYVDTYLLDCLNALGDHIGQFFIRKQFEEQLVHLATHDPLTGLFNRRRFLEELESRLAYSCRYGIHGALLFIDLDNFKQVNDTYGHQAGDELLIHVAAVLRQQLRKTDILARLGGDEFAALLSHVDKKQAETIAQQMIEIMSQKGNFIHGHATGVTASIGIALFPSRSSKLSSLLACADHAMYLAKEKGRNCFCFYHNDSR